jgi:DNA-binding GntR family transcriptional regulator
MQRTINKSEPKQRLSTTAYEAIYRRIMTLAFEPGQRLEEKMLMELLDIGRTPIREALMHLADDYMVESHPKAGVIVRPITIQNTRATFAALKILEVGVAELAMGQEITALLNELADANQAVREAIKKMEILALVEANGRFHHIYARCSKNDYLVNCLHKVRCETNRLAYLSYGNEIDPHRTLKVHYESVVREHDAILEALRQRDAEGLRKIIYQHISMFQERIIRYIAS